MSGTRSVKLGSALKRISGGLFSQLRDNTTSERRQSKAAAEIYRRRLTATRDVFSEHCARDYQEKPRGYWPPKCLGTHSRPSRHSAVQPRCPSGRKLSSQLIIKIGRNKGQLLPSSQGGRWDFPGAHISHCSPRAHALSMGLLPPLQ